MARFTGPWPREDAEAFLREATIPVRLATRTPSGRPWMLSLWYVYEDGALWCATGADADVVEYVESDPAVAFEVSTNDPPYRGVRGNGTAHVSPDEEKELLRALLVRYLGDTDSDLARRLLRPERAEVRIEIRPDRCYAWDFSGRMPGP